MVATTMSSKMMSQKTSVLWLVGDGGGLAAAAILC